MINETAFKQKTIFSFEVFPPKKTMPIDTIFSTLDELKGLQPDFISVTFGAGGSENCNNSVEIAKHIKDVCGVESVIHMPALNMTKNDAQYVLEQFQQAGIDNILALRGDKVEGKEPANEFLHASDLISFIKDFDSKRTDGKQFKIFGACYPELHPQSKDVFEDIHLKEVQGYIILRTLKKEILDALRVINKPVEFVDPDEYVGSEFTKIKMNN